MPDNLDSLDSLGSYTAAQLREELAEGLKIYAETAWGWSELKPLQFIRQLERVNGTVVGYTEMRKGSRMTLKVPRRI